MPTKNEWLNQPVSDWDTKTDYHGFGRIDHGPTKDSDEPRRYYVVKLSLLGKQYEISRHKSQFEAATAYDVALFRLTAFAPSCSTPNFPDSFKSRVLSDVDKYCPFANILFAQLSEELRGKGIDVDALQAQKEAKISREPLGTDKSKRDPYTVMLLKTQKTAIDAHSLAIKFTEGLSHLDLRKFHDVSRVLQKAELSLNQASIDANAALAMLREYQELYQRYVAEGIIK